MLQKLISGLLYPPTHTYVLAKNGPMPTGVLAQRYAMMRALAPDFWKPADTMFLDVGCNKGFFSLAAKALFPQVVGIDAVAGYADLCRELLPSGIFRGVGFRDYVPEHLFGRVMICNGHHHLFREAAGWDWIKKLAVITTPQALVLIEGIANADDVDGTEFLGLSGAMFLGEMSPFFDLIAVGPSVDYTPGRKMWLFMRRFDGGMNQYRPYDVGAVPSLRCGDVTTGGRVAKRWHKARITRANETITKTYWPAPPTSLWPRVAIASLATGANPILHWIARGGQIVGWAEKYLEPGNDARPFPWHEYQRSLLNMGYVDTDPSNVNTIAGCVVDKNGVYPVAHLIPEHYNYVTGSMALALRRAGEPEENIMKMCSALATWRVEAIKDAL